MDSDNKLFLLDAYALIYRAYYAFIKNPRINSNGFNTSAILGFVNTLEEVLKKENPTHIGVAFDPSGPTFRHEAFEQYKAQREETPEAIRLSVPIIKDIIRAYRLEGDVVLPELGNQTMFSYWQSRLTDIFIEDIKNAGGILCNLASDEMKSLFDWKRVEKEVRVITPEFQVWKNGKWASVVIYIKMSRGEMTRFVLKNKIENPEELKHFSWEGFEFNESLSDEKKFVFTNGKEI